LRSSGFRPPRRFRRVPSPDSARRTGCRWQHCRESPGLSS